MTATNFGHAKSPIPQRPSDLRAFEVFTITFDAAVNEYTLTLDDDATSYSLGPHIGSTDDVGEYTGYMRGRATNAPSAAVYLASALSYPQGSLIIDEMLSAARHWGGVVYDTEINQFAKLNDNAMERNAKVERTIMAQIDGVPMHDDILRMIL